MDDVALEEAWRISDRLFGRLAPEDWGLRPIPLRHPIVFYVGHLPAFAWRHLAVEHLGAGACDPVLDALFARGIDPGTAREAERAAPPAWPEVERVVAYRDAVRSAIRPWLPQLAGAPDPCVREALAMVLEHELMHHETLLYLLARVDPDRLRIDADRAPGGDGRDPEPVEVRAGVVAIGRDREPGVFGWCCEHPRRVEPVRDFVIDDLPVTVGRFHRFVEQGGYDAPRWWPRGRPPRAHPAGWRRIGRRWQVRSPAGWRDLDEVAGWPVYVSLDEARAYAAWSGRRLPTEAELHRAAFTGPSGEDRPHPWGAEPPTPERGAFDFAVEGPVPVGRSPAGASAWGVQELVGNGWEWTTTPFVRWAGFRAHLPSYPGYSADFFDGEHAVVFGASWCTHARLLRRSFRNWYRRDYPYAFVTFRTVATPEAD